jgi:hypothetical protein
MDEGMMPKWYEKMSAGKRSRASTTGPNPPAKTYRTLRDFFTGAP